MPPKRKPHAQHDQTPPDPGKNLRSSTAGFGPLPDYRRPDSTCSGPGFYAVGLLNGVYEAVDPHVLRGRTNQSSPWRKTCRKHPAPEKGSSGEAVIHQLERYGSTFGWRPTTSCPAGSWTTGPRARRASSSPPGCSSASSQPGAASTGPWARNTRATWRLAKNVWSTPRTSGDSFIPLRKASTGRASTWCGNMKNNWRGTAVSTSHRRSTIL